MNIDVDSSSLLDGPNSATFNAVAGTLANTATSRILPTTLSSANKYRITFRGRLYADAFMPPNTEPFIEFSNGPIDLVGFTTESFAISFRWDLGLSSVTYTIYDNIDPGGATFNMAVGSGVPFDVRLDLVGGGLFHVYINGDLSTTNRQMFSGNENADRFSLAGIAAPPGIIAVDTFKFYQLLG
jgi:hypothetical protein